MRLTRLLTVAALAAAGAAAVFWLVDLSPRVEPDFFFSRDDPQLRATANIASRFPTPEQLVVRVATPTADPRSLDAAARHLGGALREVPGVLSVQSRVNEDPGSPLWGRLFATADPNATNLIVRVDAREPEPLVTALDAVVRDAPDTLDVQVSGVPYVLELIRRYLFRDFVVFSSAAMLVFGAALWVFYRRWAVVGGTLATCVLAVSATLLLTAALDIRIGLLTANIVTIVFVLTLSHTVFLTANWQQAAGAARPVRDAVRVTFPASVWCMVTTLLGFLSLLLASARPLRELGLAGAIGTGTAMLLAYAAYPAVLSGATPPRAGGGGDPARDPLPRRHAWAWLGAAAVLVLLMLPGVWQTNTDPPLLSYFKPGTPLRDGLERIDRDGGTSPLNVVVRDAAGQTLDTDNTVERLWAFQRALETDSAVGVVLSPVVLLAHARRDPLAQFFDNEQLFGILSTPLFAGVARSFVTPGREEGLFFIRMREAARDASRAGVVARIRQAADRNGLEVVRTGGIYELQGQLGQLIGRSLKVGLGGLVALFVVVAVVVSRSAPTAAAMVACLATIPVIVLGALGHLGMPVDIITSPAANIALAMGVDSMIHLVTRVRRLRERGLAAAAAWSEARQQLWRPIVGAAAVIVAGFGIFGLSAFPPTQRFGLAVILGTVSAAFVALVVLPFSTGRLSAARTPAGQQAAG